MTQLDLLDEPGWLYRARKARTTAAEALEYGLSQDAVGEGGRVPPSPLESLERHEDMAEGAPVHEQLLATVVRP